MRALHLVYFSFASLFLTTATAEDWLRFRGPSGSGISRDAKNIPLHWSPSANLGWKVELPGAGVSSPIVVGDRVFITCYSGYGLERNNPGEIENLKRHLLCFDVASGKKIWQQDVAARLPEDPYSGIGVTAHGYASHTPVSDGKIVVAFYGKSGVYAYDLDGNKLWNSDVGNESDPWKWGTSSSPILYRDLVIVTASAESQAIIGFDKNTGSQIWRQEAEGLDGMWGTPLLVSVSDQRTDLVMSVAKEVWGLNPENGRLRWWCQATGADQAHSSAVAADSVAYAFTGRGGGSVAVEVGGQGDVTDSKVKWNGNDSARFGSPVIQGKRIYLVANGVVKSIDRQTGETIDQLRLKGTRKGGRSAFGSLDYCSPVIAANHLYYQKGNGEMFVIALGDQLEQVAINHVTIDSESFGGTPAISDGRMFIRSNKYLYCVTDKGETAQPVKFANDDSEKESTTRNRRSIGFGRPDPSALFARRDSNQDGKLTADEISATRVKAMDSDNDNAVSKEEFLAGMRSASRRGGRRSDRKDERPDRPQRPELES